MRRTSPYPSLRPLLVLFCCLAFSGLVHASDVEQKIIINLSDQVGRENPHYHANMYFADVVARKTGGVLVVKVFPDSLLGNAQDSLEGARLGAVEMVKASAAPLSSLCPKFGIFGLPYVFTSKEHVFAALDGKVGEILREDLEKSNLKLIAFYDTGFRSVFNGRRPVHVVEDLKDLRIRVMNHPIMIETFNVLGARAVPLAYGELYGALHNGVVDGAEQPPVALYSMKFHEVSKYLSLTNHLYDLNVLVMSKEFFDKKLNASQQRVVLEAGAETQAYERKLWQEYESSAIEKIQAAGMVVNSVELVPFKKAVKGVVEKNKQIIGAAFVDLSLSYSNLH